MTFKRRIAHWLRRQAERLDPGPDLFDIPERLEPSPKLKELMRKPALWEQSDNWVKWEPRIEWTDHNDEGC